MSSLFRIVSRGDSTRCCEWARILPFVTVLMLAVTTYVTSFVLDHVTAHQTPRGVVGLDDVADEDVGNEDVADDDEDGWVTVFDGESYDGWRINENEESWKIEEGAFVANGDRSHLFYVGDLQPMKDFELKVDVMTREGANGGIYFHTKYQDSGWPAHGYESQVNNTQRDPQKTGGLYNTVRVEEAPAKDDVWWTHHIIVEGSHVIVKIDDQVVVDYDEPEGKEGDVRLSEGTIAFQAHDPGSTVYFKNVRLKVNDD